jgi:methionine-rich copper-binding protein CopC
MKRSLSIAGSLVILALSMGLLPSSALAHNKLLKTDPGDAAAVKSGPSAIQLWFQEKPDLTVTRVLLKGPSGPVELGPVHVMSGNEIMADLKAKLAPGSYVVDWQTAGDDGHVSKGEFTFTVAP